MVPYDPKNPAHKNRTLYEVRSEEVDGVFFTTFEKSDESYESADRTPWYFVVETAVEAAE